MTIKVKPLVWTRGVVDWAKPMPGMKYVACSAGPSGCWSWWLDGAEITHTVENDEASAKAAAQADYQARILSAIEAVEEPPYVLQEAITEAEASRHTFCLASPGSDDEFHAYLLGFDSALNIFRKASEAIEAVDPATIRAEALREARQLVGCWGGEEGPDAIATPEEPYTKGFLAAIFHAQAQIDALIDKEQDR